MATGTTDVPPDFSQLSRMRGKRFEHRQPGTDIFSGQHFIEEAVIETVKVLRLSVIAAGEKAVPFTFSLDKQPQWTASSAALPLDFTWQQSLPARFDFLFDLPATIKCYGLGERFSALDLRGGRHTLISTDNPNHDESSDCLYKSIPFLLLNADGLTTGIFLDTPAPQVWDLDSELDHKGRIELFSRRGWQLYCFGPAPLPEVVSAYTSLTGRCHLPPRWSLGHQQARWSYPDEETVRQIAHEYRARKIPCDTLVLDIDYMDEFRVFTSSAERFPNLKGLIADLAREDFKVVTIVDPGVKEDPHYRIYEEGRDQSLFCKTSAGDIFIETVWPGRSAFPDFLMEETRRWWATHLDFYRENGVAGIWNDMNEPAMFGITDMKGLLGDELPADDQQLFLQQAPEGKVGHLEVRNLYGTLMSRATHEGLLRQCPNERPFVLTRSGGPGIQRYAAVWLGDNKSWWEHLRKCMPMLVNVGLSGVPFAGVDIGGFGGDCSPEMLIRWYEMGIFFPFFRNHCWLKGRSQEPFAYSSEVENKIRLLIDTRYKLLPYINNLFWEHGQTGAPLLRPLLWHYPDDPIAVNSDSQFMFGKDLLIAPALERAATHRYVYLPHGDWYAFESGQHYRGGQSHYLETPLGMVPAFVRGGSILPLAESMQSTAQYDGGTITFTAFGDDCLADYFEDDGISWGYQRGAYNHWRLTVKDQRFEAVPVHSGLTETSKHAYFWQSHMHAEKTPIKALCQTRTTEQY